MKMYTVIISKSNKIYVKGFASQEKARELAFLAFCSERKRMAYRAYMRIPKFSYGKNFAISDSGGHPGDNWYVSISTSPDEYLFHYSHTVDEYYGCWSDTCDIQICVKEIEIEE